MRHYLVAEVRLGAQRPASAITASNSASVGLSEISEISLLPQLFNWTFYPDNEGKSSEVVQSVLWDPKLRELTASWSSQVFLASKGLLIYVAGSSKDDTLLIQYEVGAQDKKEVFLAPNGGWTGEQRHSIVDGIHVKDEVVLILGSQQNSPVDGYLWAGVWPAGGGKPKAWHKLGQKPLYYRGRFSVDDPVRMVIVGQDSNGLLEAFSAGTGQRLWASDGETKYRSEIETLVSLGVPSPILTNQSGSWRLLRSDQYREIAFRVLTGGGDGRELTNLNLPDRERERIDKMLEWVRRKR